jgi:hypothetical protein
MSDRGTRITLLSRRPLRIAAAATVTGFLVAGWALMVGGRR